MPFCSPLCFGPLRRLRRHLPRTRGRLPSQSRRPCGRLASSPGGRAKFTSVGKWKVCGKMNFLQLCLTTNFSKTDAGTLASPCGGGSTALCAVTERGGSHACGTAQLRRCLRQKQPKRSRGSGLSFARPKQKQGTATVARRAGEGQAHPAEQKQKTPPSGLGTEEPFVRRKIRRECFCVPGDWTCKPVLVGTA